MGAGQWNVRDQARGLGDGQNGIEHQQGIGSGQDQGGQRPAPIAQCHPEFQRPGAPAKPVPALKGDAVDPAGFLPHRGAQRPGEATAGYHQAAVRRAQPQESTATTDP